MAHPFARFASLLLLCSALPGWTEDPASTPAPGDAAARLAAAEAALAEGEAETAMAGFQAAAEAALALPPRRVPLASLEACLRLAHGHDKLRETDAAMYWAGRVPQLDPHNLHQLWDDALLRMLSIAQGSARAPVESSGRFSSNTRLFESLLRHIGGYPHRPDFEFESAASFSGPLVINAFQISLVPLQTGIGNAMDPKQPEVARVPALEEPVKNTTWSHLATSPVGKEVWGFHAGVARVTAFSAPEGKTREFPHASPFTDIQASQTFSNEIWLASASLPLLARLDGEGRLLGTHALRRPAASFAVRTSTRHVFSAGEGRLWRHDLETGENRDLGLAAQRVAMPATETGLFVAAAGLDERDRTSHPVLRATLRDSTYLTQGKPYRGMCLVSCALSPWGEVWPCAVCPSGDSRVLSLEAGWGARSVYLTSWQSLQAPESFPQGLGRFTRYLHEPMLAGVGGTLNTYRGINQAMLGAWCSPRYETLAMVYPGGLCFQHCHDGGSVSPESMHGAQTLLPIAAWSGDGRLFVCATSASPDGPAGGVMAVSYKPTGLDAAQYKARAKARAQRAPVDPTLLAARREEWTASLEAPAGFTVAFPTAPGARSAVLATAHLPLPPARPGWADTAAASPLDPALRAELDRLLTPDDSAADPGPRLARALRAATAAGSHPAGAAAVARWQVRAGLHAPALTALDGVVRADAGRTDLTHLALEAMAEAHAAAGRAPEALAALAVSLTLDPLREASLSAAARLGAQARPAPGPGPGPAVDPPAAPAAPALSKDDLLQTLDSCLAAARLDGGGNYRAPMPALLLDAEGLMLTHQPWLRGRNEPVEVRFFSSRGGAPAQPAAPIPARIVRLDETTGLVLVRLKEKPPASARPAIFAAAGPREGEDVFLPHVRDLREEEATYDVRRGLAGKPAGTLHGLPVITHSATGENASFSSPLLNAAGQVVGLNIGLPGQNLTGIAVPVEVLRAWLKGNPAP